LISTGAAGGGHRFAVEKRSAKWGVENQTHDCNRAGNQFQSSRLRRAGQQRDNGVQPDLGAGHTPVRGDVTDGIAQRDMGIIETPGFSDVT
jgi:hypothetical protein